MILYSPNGYLHHNLPTYNIESILIDLVIYFFTDGLYFRGDIYIACMSIQ